MSYGHDWQYLPVVVFDEIQMMIGLKSLNNLHKCRQVCWIWNEMTVKAI